MFYAWRARGAIYCYSVLIISLFDCEMKTVAMKAYFYPLKIVKMVLPTGTVAINADVYGACSKRFLKLGNCACLTKIGLICYICNL